MAYSSSTRCWAACSKDQRREMIAHAVFVKLTGLSSAAEGLMRSIKRDLGLHFASLKKKNLNELSKEDFSLLSLEKVVDSMGTDITGIEKLEKHFGELEKYITVNGTESLSSSLVKKYLSNKELAKIVRTKKNFSWTGGSTRPPRGKVSAQIGISDELLETVLEDIGGASLLDSWLATGDATWKRWVDSEVDKRKREAAALKAKNPKDSQIFILENQIERLEKKWQL